MSNMVSSESIISHHHLPLDQPWLCVFFIADLTCRKKKAVCMELLNAPRTVVVVITDADASFRLKLFPHCPAVVRKRWQFSCKQPTWSCLFHQDLEKVKGTVSVVTWCQGFLEVLKAVTRTFHDTFSIYIYISIYILWINTICLYLFFLYLQSQWIGWSSFLHHLNLYFLLPTNRLPLDFFPAMSRGYPDVPPTGSRPVPWLRCQWLGWWADMSCKRRCQKKDGLHGFRFVIWWLVQWFV